MDNFDEKPFGALLAALKKNQHKFLKTEKLISKPQNI